MPLDHEKLDVYKLALEFLVFAHHTSAKIPRGAGYLADQLRRAASSIVLNISEGAGKQSRADKQRYYLSARGSAGECSGVLDALLGFELMGGAECVEQKERLERIYAMLTKLALSMERRGGSWKGRER